MADSDQQLLRIKMEISDRKYQEALDLLEAVTAGSSEEQAQKLVLQGQSFEGLNDATRAYDAYSRAQSLAPTFAAPILREAVLRYRQGDAQAARTLLYRYVRIEPGNPEAFYYLYLCERDPLLKSSFVRRVVVLDGPTGEWSKELVHGRTEI